VVTDVPAVSIVLPTYNRGDVLGQAIESVRRQTFEDWELLVVDDGSTDGSAERVADLDRRIVVVRQENAGVYAARNTGLGRARGRWVAFLDSDDQWAPHYLDLVTSFLAYHPDAAFVTTEFWEDWGGGTRIRHDLHEVRDKYPRIAKAVGSRLFALPPGETDDYLRVYTARRSVGPWGKRALAAAGVDSASSYHGHIFSHMRFGYLNWLPTTTVTRAALNAVGPFSTRTRSTADYRFLCRLARLFEANMIAVPSATKFERAPDGKALRNDHLASGRGAYPFAVNMLSYFDEIYAEPMRGEREVALLRRHYCLRAGRAALMLGLRAEARTHFREARALKGVLWRGYAGSAIARLMPSDHLAGAGVRAATRAWNFAEALGRGEITVARVRERLFGGERS
jgi:glycosyltransferase involved in cell wall biosynthesis